MSKLAKQHGPDRDDADYRGPGPTSAFAPLAGPRERIQGLLDLGISVEDIAVATGVKPGTVRKWASGIAHPRRDAEQGIDDLRQIIVILDEADLPPEKITQWLRSRHRGILSNERPLDVIRTDPLPALAAAEQTLIERDLKGAREQSLQLVEGDDG